ncbi:MAG: XRE family transcriptional regulator [Enterococcus avium]
MSIFSNELDRLMKQSDMSNETLGELVGVNRTTVSRWRSGERSPKMTKLSDIADVFKVDARIFVGEMPVSDISIIYNKLEPPRQEKVYVFAKNQLEEQDRENSRNKNITSLEQYKERKQQKKSMATIDWCGAVSAGTGEFLVDEYREQIALPTEIIPDDADFCLTVNGDSMEPIFHNNDYVFIKKQLEIYSGAIGVVVVNGAAFLKRVWFENNHARLQSFNSNYKDIIVTDADDFRIIGKVVM